MARKKTKIKKTKKQNCYGLRFYPGDIIATIQNYNTNYGDENRKKHIIKVLKDKGIQKIKYFPKNLKGRSKVKSVENFFKSAA